MKFTTKFIISIVLILSFIVINAAASGAKTAPYYSNVEGQPSTMLLVPADATGYDILSSGHADRVLQTGFIGNAKVHVSNVNRIDSFIIRVWTKDTGTGLYNLHSASGNLKPQLVNGIVNLSISPAIACTEGDYIGLYIHGDCTGTPLAPTPGVLNIVGSSEYWDTDIVMFHGVADAYNMNFSTARAGMTEIWGVLPIDTYCVQEVGIDWFGDSIISGAQTDWHYGSAALTTQPLSALWLGFNPNYTVEHYFQQLAPVPYQNLGISGDKYPHLRTRLQNDVINYRKPAFCAFDGGINNIIDGDTAAVIFPYVRDQILALQAAGIKPLVILVLPANGGLNGTVTTQKSLECDKLNNLIIAYQNTNKNFKIVDARSALGTYSAVTGWTMQPQNSGDGVHLTTLGNQILAQKVYDAYSSEINTASKSIVYVSFGGSAAFSNNGNNSIISTKWFVDGVEVNGNSSVYVYTGDMAGIHTVTSVSYFPDGSSQAPEVYNMIVGRQLAGVTTVTQLDTTHTQPMMNAILDQNITAGMEQLPYPFTDIIGKVFYLVIFSLVFVFIRINSGSLNMPLMLFLAIGWIVIGFVPADYHYMIWIVFSMSIMAILYSMIKRGD